jgi:hypothetical protein
MAKFKNFALQAGIITGLIFLTGCTYSMKTSKDHINEKKIDNDYIYLIEQVSRPAAFENRWNSRPWKNVGTLKINNFLEIGSVFQPLTSVKAVYDSKDLYVFFRVKDRYVRCINKKFQSATNNDSCVEFFVRPKPDAGIDNSGYFNFEINCGGTVKCRYTKIDTEEKKISTHKITMQQRDQLKIYHSLPEIVEPEIKTEITWYLGLYVPFDFFEYYVGHLTPVSGQAWRANFYKCGNETSHPHYGCWSPVDRPDFHTPHCFGYIVFEK